jgi:acetoin utilization protein AcuB
MKAGQRPRIGTRRSRGGRQKGMTMRVKDVMTREPITIDPDAPIGTALAVMRRSQVRHLPVIDVAGTLVGIVTDRDLRSAAFAPALAEHLSLRGQRRLRGLNQTFENIQVKDVMTWNVVTTHPEATLEHAALRMLEGRFGGLPVVEAGKLIGILTERDLLAALLKESPRIAVEREAFLW